MGSAVNAFLLSLARLAPGGHVAQSESSSTLLVRLIKTIERDRLQSHFLSLLLISVVISCTPTWILLCVENFLLLGKFIVRLLFFFSQFSPLLPE